MFSKVLVANRGEIAVRLIRGLDDLGIASVAVYSEPDADAMHVRMAGQAVPIGPAPPVESYLDQPRIVDAAQQTGADAIHPGYGFLSENASFALACRSAGLAFVGPSPEAMQVLGDKVRARKLAIELDVPVAPGSEGVVADVKQAAEVARDVGFPVMLKAAAGGGGMGIRVVGKSDEMEEAFGAASAQAQAAFGDGSMFIERYLERPRHIEVQVLGGPDGAAVHLFERECSVQRRHQKLLEEAPSASLSPSERAEVTGLATRLVGAAGYENAGTVEFLHQDGRFYFNEVNTRLQVEHPVTEMVTGIDLVEWQLRLAAGEGLELKQTEIALNGHAVECRINAEDPARAFAPTPGPVVDFQAPGRSGIRVDTGLFVGWTVPSQYDSLVAKLIAWAPTRRDSLDSMAHVLDETIIDGFTTNIGLHRRIVADKAFRAGDVSTRFLEERGILDAVAGEAATMGRRAASVAMALAQGASGGLGGLAVRHTRPRRID